LPTFVPMPCSVFDTLVRSFFACLSATVIVDTADLDLADLAI
jgi:hypothetical protein